MPVVPAKEAEAGGHLKPVEVEGAGERKEERKGKRNSNLGGAAAAGCSYCLLFSGQKGKEAIGREFHECSASSAVTSTG